MDRTQVENFSFGFLRLGDKTELPQDAQSVFPFQAFHHLAASQAVE
jgi:hypothetical protein